MSAKLELILLRGSKAENDAFIGHEGSISLDMESYSIRIHDGVTPGGHEIPNDIAVKQYIQEAVNQTFGTSLSNYMLYVGGDTNTLKEVSTS